MPTITGDNFYIDKHTLQFRTGTSSLASIAYSKTQEEISISNEGTGAINIGDAGGDIYIGDGSIETDIVFEQNGSIRALTDKTLKLGQSDSDVQVNAQNLIVSGDAGFSGTVTIGGNPVMTGDSGYDSDTLQTVTDRGNTTNLPIVATMFSGTNGQTQLKGSTTDSSAYTFIARNYASTSLLSIRNDGRIDAAGPVNIGNNLYLDNNEIWAQNSNNLNVKADGLIRIQPQSYGTAATFAADGNVGIGVGDPAYRLVVAGGDGNIEIGSGIFNDYNAIRLNDSSNSSDYNLLSSATDTNLYINRPASKNLYFRCNNSTQMVLDGNGMLQLTSSDPVLKITDTSTSDNTATLWLQESDSYGVKLNYESHGSPDFRQYLSIDTLATADSSNQLGDHLNVFGVDIRGNITPHKGATDGNLLTPYEWDIYSLNSGSTYRFNQNGDQNTRVLGLNPHGDPATLWRAGNDVDNNDDGGWNTDYFEIDRTKTYRSSVWVRKDYDVEDGELYFGTTYVDRLSNGNYDGNPYWIYPTASAANGIYSGEWYLMVGYVYPSGTTPTATPITRGGVYNRNGEKILDTNYEFRWTSSGDSLFNPNTSRQRVYNYYDTGVNNVTYWWQPRFEPIEADTPSLRELLDSPSSQTGAYFMGKVGIGTDNPASPLSVVGTARIDGSDGDGVLTIANSAGSQSLRIDQNSLRTTTTNDLTLFTKDNTSQLVLDQGGSVGIGTNSPQGKVNISTNLNSESDPDAGSKYALHLHNGQDDTDESIGLAFGISSNTAAVGAAIAHERKGSTSYGDLYFSTRSSGGSVTERMRIASDGNVGIGTDNPDRFVVIDAGGGYPLKVNSTQDYMMGLARGGTEQWWFKVNTAGDFTIHENAADDRFRIKAGGDVGIGEADPDEKLEVAGNILAKDAFVSAGLGAARGYQFHDFGTGWGYKAVTSSSRLGIFTDTVERVTIDANGTVGIGSTTPSFKLDVSTSTSDDGIRIRNTAHHASVTVHSNNSYNSYLRFRDDTNRYWLQCSSDDHLYFRPNAIDPTSGSAITFSSGGNIGIGSHAPTERLEVAPDTDVSAIIGKAHIGDVGHDGYAGFSHVDTATATNYGIIQRDNGQLNINSPAGINTYFCKGGSIIGGFNATSDFYVDTNTLFVDVSQNNVGVGTSTNHASSKLTIQANNTNDIITGLVINSYQSTTGTAGKGVGIVMGQDNGTYASKIANIWTNNNPSYLQTNIAFYTMHDSYAAGSETEKMRLTSKGYLGIGTGSPRGMLDVVGNTDDDTDFLTIHDIDPSAGSHRPSIRFRSDSAQIGQIVALDNGMRFSVGTSETSHLEIRESTKNVGVGTGDPSYRLTVNAGNINEIARFHSEDNDALISISDNTDIVYVGIDAANDVMSLGFDSSMGTSNNLNITTAGYVGIGTNDPYLKFYVDGNSRVEGNLMVGDAARANTPSVALHIKSSSTNAKLRIEDSDSSNQYWDFYVNQGDGLHFNEDTENRVTFKEGGNVGIGTVSPSGKLDIYGTNGTNAFNIIQGGESAFRYSTYLESTNTNTPVFRQGIYYNTTENATIAYCRGGSSVGGFLTFQTNNGTERMRIESNGDVGIGTTDPAFLLDVSGGVARINSPSAGFSEALRLQRDGGNYYSIGLDNNDLNFCYNGQSADGSTLVIDGGANAVGIGTKTPAFKLDVQTSVGGLVARFKDSDSSHDGLRIEGDTNGAIICNDSSLTSEAIYLQNSANAMRFYAAGTEKMRISSSEVVINENSVDVDFRAESSGDSHALFVRASDGNVGIGTANPQANLHIFKTEGGVGAKHATIRMGGYLGVGPEIAAYRVDGNSNNQGLIFSTNDATAGLRDVLSLNNDGNVGIGTNSPTSNLHINGRNLVESPTVPSTLAISDSGDASKNLRLGYEPTWDVGSISASDLGAGWKDIVIAPIAGSVGIGTTNPPHTLSVKGTISRLNSSSIQVVNLGVTSEAGDITVNNAGGVTKARINSNGDSYFNGGDVGIGTDTPITTLHVQQSDGSYPDDASNHLVIESSSHSYIGIGGGTASDVGIHFGDSGGINRGRIAYKNSDDSMRFNTSAAERLTLSGGNVGIGSATPAAQLDVNGIIKQLVYIFSYLPSASIAGQRAFISDSAYAFNSSYVGQQAAGGGSNFSPVYSDGGYWMMG